MGAERMRRIAGVTLGLAAAGAVTGGALGLLFVSVLAVWIGMESIGMLLEMLRMGVIWGGVLGTVLGPAAAWMLMRHVPLWMAIGGTAAGTLAGAMAGLVIPQLFPFTTLAGFGAAALWLRLHVPRDPRRTALPARGE